MKILVTGSQGTLGTKLVEELSHRGHDVFGCDLHHGEKNEIRADVSESRQVERAFTLVQPELVYHLAAEFGRVNGQEYYEQLWKTNCVGTRNVIEACIKHDAHLVFASSSEVYGNIADDDTPLHEYSLLSRVPEFHNEYALTKYTNEKQIHQAIKNFGLKATILRFFNAYGPGEKYSDYRSVVCLFVYRLLHDMQITVYKDYHRVFMYVDDWKRTVANVAERKLKNGETINVGGEEYTSIEILVSKLKKLIQKSSSEIALLPKEKANITNKKPDISKAQLLLDHKCSINLDEGLPLTVEWMKSYYGIKNR